MHGSVPSVKVSVLSRFSSTKFVSPMSTEHRVVVSGGVSEVSVDVERCAISYGSHVDMADIRAMQPVCNSTSKIECCQSGHSRQNHGEDLCSVILDAVFYNHGSHILSRAQRFTCYCFRKQHRPKRTHGHTYGADLARSFATPARV